MNRILFLFLSLLSFFAPSATGQMNKAKATLYTRTEGTEVRAALVIRIEAGFHLYHHELGAPDSVGKPLKVGLEGEGVSFDPLIWPEPERFEQPKLGHGGSDTFILGHEGRIVIYGHGTFTGEASSLEVAATLDGLTCESSGSCFPYVETVEAKGEGRDKYWEGYPEQPAEETEEEESTSGFEMAGDFSLEGDESHASARLHHRFIGQTVEVSLAIDIDSGWHLYHDELGPADAIGIPTGVLLSAPGVTWSEVVFPEPHKTPQSVGLEGTPTWIWAHDGAITLFARGEFESQPPTKVSAKIDGLTCEDMGSCVPYSEHVSSLGKGTDQDFTGFPAVLEVGVQTREAPSEIAPVSRETESAVDYDSVIFPDFTPREDKVEHGLFAWLLLAFLAGMILNVMPCVLPVISIKILSFVQQAGEDRKRILALGLAFAAGILVVFLVLAGVAIYAGMSWGEQFQSTGFLVIMIGIVFGLALSLFGLYELGVPRAVGGMAAGPPREGLVDAFLKGMLATILATPCSGPFLGSTLTWTLSQTSGVIFLVFLFLGLGMAFPYVLLTANPKLLKFLPKPGPWMETFKESMGFVLLLTVIYLLTIVPQTELLYTAAFLVFVALGCWVWGRFATLGQSLLKRNGILVLAFLVVIGGYRVSFHWFKGLFEVGTEQHWVDFDHERFAQALDSGQNVMVDFTADWCPNCKFNEATVFESEEIQDLIQGKGVLMLKADLTTSSPYTSMLGRLRDQLGARSIPFVAFFPGDDPQRPHTRLDIVTVSDIAGILESMPETRGAAARGH
jgi:suppressor for copper-sensitivity B